MQCLVSQKSMLSTKLYGKPAHFPGSLALPLNYCEKDKASVKWPELFCFLTGIHLGTISLSTLTES